ncbi:hypothetical protein [Desulfatitalea alkaliphila]|uniref:Uncharacterized protein n=1 Tax=Desulfatitalea alkaliphila TaxID=2929485 RepID=A0AA41R723_9BACT|nr:hypothetical protein [Desulfatitalea alkaliphila]MCJ8502420.1 hypothetical protein [Desulfatitalea alkaliphila]
MWKRLLPMVLGLLLWAVGVGADVPVASLETFIATHRAEILKLDREEAIRSYFATHLLGAYGDVANLVGFADTLTQGVYLKEIDYLLKEKILEVRIDARSLRSVDKIRGHLTRIRRLGKHPYQWPAEVSHNPATGEIRYGFTLGTKPPFIQLRYEGRVGADGRTAAGTFRREGGSGTAWSGTWQAVRR